jgi:hypothetical protein
VTVVEVFVERRSRSRRRRTQAKEAVIRRLEKRAAAELMKGGGE